MADLDAFFRAYAAPTQVLGATDWAAVEQRLGTALPSDYKAIIDTYGVGSFDRTLAVYAPDDQVTGGVDGLFDHLHEQRGYIETVQNEFRTLVADGTDPEEIVAIDEDGGSHLIDVGGIPLPFLPCGIVETGEYLYWDTTEIDPDTWPVIMTDLGGKWLWGSYGLAQLIIDTQSGRYPESLVVPVDTLPSFGPVP